MEVDLHAFVDKHNTAFAGEDLVERYNVAVILSVELS